MTVGKVKIRRKEVKTDQHDGYYLAGEAIVSRRKHKIREEGIQPKRGDPKEGAAIVIW